ncbi:putative bifunctional diguanylate cyclase/phosphodiesterase [Quatrionicoccus australiensis]|uniref:putative bifunctional diguanylate cyclase/phosphodiesterase n=1 Tax=Quatrionicoccus australiensis TaxID=138118 RepID=UPI001CF927F5|nr:GGDEF and EAL domain-containing protein [Quatrionicoccus australiensis]UCV15647.1 EAL domain-containing protein [Quatrionicoccus australiensis]
MQADRPGAAAPLSDEVGPALSGEVLQRVFLQSHEAVLVCDAANRIVAANPAFVRLTGYTLAEVAGQDPKFLASGRTDPLVYESMWQALQETGFWQGEIWDRRKDGSVFPKWVSISALRDAAGAILNYVASFTDVSESREAADRLVHLAYHDPLTHLPNRLAFESQLELALRTCERDNSQIALMLIDLDRFKNINDTLGHHVGDGLLRQVALRLRESVRASDIVARLGGDEFTVVLPDIDSALTAASVAGKLQRALAGSYQVGEHTLYATPSIGISVFPSDGRDGETMLRNADTAMYHAKNAGRDNYQFYAARMNEAAGERLQMENALRHAVSSITPTSSQFSLHFQPQMHIESGRIVGLEALARWNHPTLGQVPPTRFIAIAEETGLILPLGDWVFWESCRHVSALRKAGIADIRVAINISAQQLRHENLPFVVRGALACYDLQPSDIELEITESTAMQNPEVTLEILNQFSDMGIVLAIDDFGTGYSSLAYLKHLPIHRLKLDRSFVKDIETDINDKAICSATVALGHNLGLELVAEGVETLEQRDFLARLGCDVLQGFLYSKPMPAELVVDYLRGMAEPGVCAANAVPRQG